MRDNYIRIPQRERNSTVYRFTTIERLLNMVVQRTNTLVAPRKWEDPFENALATRIRLRRSDGSTAHYPLHNRAYGQCWTFTRETDAAWRMYVPRGSGVRLRSTIRKLYSSLEKQCPKPYESMACFIGRVEYKSGEEITALFNDKEWVNDNFRGQGTHGHVDTLLLKRTEFEPEAEARLLYLDPRNKDHGDFFTYSIDPPSLFEQITFDPRMEDMQCSTYESILRSYGYAGEINKSGLYKAPDIEICV
jgi:hypothetical protein